MHTPTKAQWQKVIDNLSSVIDRFPEGELNMMEREVNNGHECGTVHCVGGWYAIANNMHKNGLINFRDGSHLMAEHLGFESDWDLEEFYQHHNDVWGNQLATLMFSCESAFDGAETIQEVIEHMKGVRDRSPEQNLNNMHTPTKAQWQKVIDNLESVVVEFPKGRLDMHVPEVNASGYECGTVHCVGGWYAVAKRMHQEGVVEYKDGANAIAKDLGFSSMYAMETFYSCESEIWGNLDAGGMFCMSEAYDGAGTIKEVIEHMKGVRDRSPD